VRRGAALPPQGQVSLEQPPCEPGVQFRGRGTPAAASPASASAASAAATGDADLPGRIGDPGNGDLPGTTAASSAAGARA